MERELGRVAGGLERLYGEGGLSEQSAAALEQQRDTIGKGLGEPATGSELLLVSILVDDSTSVATNLNEIGFGYDQMLQALKTHTVAETLVLTALLNRGVVTPFTPLGKILSLSKQGYSGAHLFPRTPLYRQSLITLGSVMVKAQEEEARGATVRTFTLIISDAEDNQSGDIKAGHVKAVVADMLEFATNHLIFGMGVGEREGVNFYEVFGAMGIPRKWVFSAGISADELRGKFEEITKKLELAASSESAFLQLVVESSGGGGE